MCCGPKSPGSSHSHSSVSVEAWANLSMESQSEWTPGRWGNFRQWDLISELVHPGWFRKTPLLLVTLCAPW